ncbi:MAG: host-nuclease inhibitor Gam family protein [Deltaproteobacteria bacterium]|nr:host-nuclease inhibitor Gam family protein [Deltaproteobacteria bacterium]
MADKMTMIDIERLTREFAEARAFLETRVEFFNEEVSEIEKRRLPGIKASLKKVKKIEDKLKAAIESCHEHFTKPKMQTFCGIKVGFQKNKGTMEMRDPDSTIEKIKKLMPDKVEMLIRVTEEPDKKALSNLSADVLKKLGVTISNTGDTVVIKPAKRDIDKTVEALLKNADKKV